MPQHQSPGRRGLQFIRGHAVLILVISALIIVPCFWHRRIEAGDLASHVYNAWLAQLIEKGQAPGLHFVSRWNNVLFDVALLHLANLAGLSAASKILVAACALIFFWGAFALIANASGRTPWFLTPVIAMLAYGYTFNAGFFNYYLSIGLASFSLALFWHARGREYLYAVAVAPLVLLAHPIGFLWLLGTAGYVFVRRRFPGWSGLALPAAVLALFAALRWYLLHRTTFEISWTEKPWYFYNGADQFVLYTSRFSPLAWAILAAGLFGLVVETVQWKKYSQTCPAALRTLEIYLVAVFSAALLPENIRSSPASAWVGLLVSRLTIVAAIFALCALSCLVARKWQLLAGLVCSVFFFSFLYSDTALLNRLEDRAEKITASLPFGTLVIPVLEPPFKSRLRFVGHLVDRACIGHCFTFSNYEPSSGQFRIRSEKGSPIATASAHDSQEMEGGDYVVLPTDPPFKNIYSCRIEDPQVLCLREIRPGDQTGSGETDFHPEDAPDPETDSDSISQSDSDR